MLKSISDTESLINLNESVQGIQWPIQIKRCGQFIFAGLVNHPYADWLRFIVSLLAMDTKNWS